MNAMLGPLCARYIRALQDGLREEGFRVELLFMGSNGGLADAALVAARPVLLLESGPAGGVSAAIRFGALHGWPDAILGDMGGTTFDVSLVREGRAELRSQVLLHSYAVRAPSIDIESIGAGGGSIAWVDAGGGVRIGPQSAAADPGPACYGRGGIKPTVTDCNLILGHIDPDTFLDGRFRLDRSAAERAVDEHLAKPLGMGVVEAAHAVRAVANALMAQATFTVCGERGVHAPLGQFGGAPGATFRCEVERDGDVTRVPAKGSHEMVHAGDRVLLQPAGSGGYGDPHGRDRARLLDDLKDGYVTAAALTREWGLTEAEASALVAEASDG